MTATNVNVHGVVKFFDQKKGFGIITTKQHAVYIHASKAGGKQAQLVTGAEVRIDYITAYKDGEYKHSATALLSVKAPPAPVEVLDVVKFYNPAKNFGFILCGGAEFSKGEAILRGHVAKQAGIIPGKGMPVRAMVVQKPEGPEVVSFEWGPEIEAAYAAKLGELHAEDGADVELHTADSVDELLQTHAAETQAALGQKPAGEDESSEPVPVKKPKKPRAKKATTTTAAPKVSDLPDGPMAEQLRALTQVAPVSPGGNGALTH